ncbi:retrotransposon protein, putative, ty1-copia subclass [Tanacetum coccineum]
MVNDDPFSSSVLINNLDAGLHMNPNDSTSTTFIPFKLLGTENYRICLDRCNAVVLTWIMNSVSSDVYMGLVYSVDAKSVWKELESTYDKVDACDANKELDLHNKLMKLMQLHMGLDECYLSVRSSLLSRDPLLEVKDAYTIVSREGSHRWTPESSSLTDSKLNATSFVAKSSNTFKRADDESFDQCISCLSGKMKRNPFPHRTERAIDLLGLIHTDVCGPLRHVSRQGASYFITFMDDFSRYGYVCLLKHKHEVFKTFKVFKNEVENQLGKTIKALRLDRGGEYIGKEFKDYLKACGIVQQLTPPYTPQHNGVFERKNHTLLDMVRSMMNLKILSLSFLDYTLESATRILNIVTTKKVDTTPYELWAIELEEIQDKDTSPSKNTCKIPVEVEDFDHLKRKKVLNHLKRKLFPFVGTDIAKITRKRSKPDKHEHENGKSAQEPGV